jgi:hypothetical protein
MDRIIHCLKGQCYEIFYHQTTFLVPIDMARREFFFIRGVIHICNWLLGVFTTMESGLPSVFIAGKWRLPGDEYILDSS